MNRSYAPLLALLIMAVLGFCNAAFGDELKDISQLVGQGQHAQALDKVNTYLAAHPKDVSAQFLKGVILAEQNKSAEAIKIFTAITEKHPELPEPYNNLAVMYAAQGQYDKARQALEKAIRTHPSYATAHENLGDIYAKMASDAYDKALQIDRSNSRAQTKLSMVKELFSSSSLVPPPAIHTEEPAKVAANVPSATVIPAVPGSAASPAPAKPEEPAVKPIPAVKESKPADKPAVKEEPKPKEEKPKEEAKPKEEGKPVTQQAVLDSVQGWARAWSSRDVDAYLAYYANDFKTPNGQSRGDWEKMRKERIRKATAIEVEVLNPKVSVDGNRATVEFKQSYRAGGNSMRTNKTLHLARSGDKWLITQELANH